MKICEAYNCNDKNTIKQSNIGSKYKKLCDETLKNDLNGYLQGYFHCMKLILRLRNIQLQMMPSSIVKN